jgi:hypothetical protein
VADKNQEDLDKEIEAFKKSSAAVRKTVEDIERSFGLIYKNLTPKELKEKILEATKSLSNMRDNFKRDSASISKDILELSKNFRENGISAKALENDLYSLRSQIANVADKEQKRALIDAKSELEQALAKEQTTQILKDSFGRLAGVSVGGLIKAFSGATKAFMSGGDGFQVAQSFMTSQIDLANGASQVGSKALQDFGTATAGAGGKIGMLGVAASVTGGLLSMLGNEISELAKAGIGFMITQTQKTITNFQLMNHAGALFAGGMEEMRRTASSAGLTLEQLSKVSAQYAGRMADGGMTVSDATKQIAGVGREFDKDGGKVRKQLLSLGYSFEEQAEISAKVASDMNRGVPPAQRASTAQVAAETQKYAENLRLLSDLTGEDAKAKAEKIRDENTELAFEAEKSKMSPKQRAELETAMAGMTEIERKNLRERMIFGTVINKAGAIQEATVDGQREKGERFAQLLKQNNLTTETVINENAKYADRIGQATIENAGTIGAAGAALGGEYADMAKNQADSLRQSRQYNAENIAETKKNLAEQKNGTGSKKIIDAQIAAQKLMVDAEKIATDNMAAFATAVAETTKQIESSIKALADFSAGKGASSGWMATLTGVLSGAVQVGFMLLANKMGGGGGAGLGDLLSGAGKGGGGAGVLGRIGSTLVKAGPGLLKGGAGAIAGYGLGKLGDYETAQGNVKTGAGLDIGSKALEWGGTGAMLGSVIPGIGTAVGAGLGAVAGGAYGLYNNWNTLTGPSSTPATAAAASMNPASASMSNTTPEGKPESDRMYDKIVELATSSKAVADALSKDALADMANANQKMADAQRDLANYSKDMRDTLNKLLQVSR